MSFFKIFCVLVSAILVTGCGNLRGSKLLAPESFGLSLVEPGLYVETGADEATRNKLRQAVAKAEKALQDAYGSVKSRPIVNVCISRECYAALGGSSSTVGGAFIFINRLLLSPDGQNWHFIAHEWSHRELLSRMSFFTWSRMPTWFDEGLAVAVSEAPEHSDIHWQFLASNNIPRPTREEIYGLKSLKQWHSAIGKYGEDKNAERRAKREPLINPVYAAAGREIRPWLAKVGSSGLLALIAQLNNGEDFDAAYLKANPAASLSLNTNSR